MKFSIAQIGQNRLKKVLLDDRDQNPQKLCEVISGDIYNVAKCYMENPSVKVQTSEDGEDIIFEVKIATKRIKSIGVLST